eukprot:GHVQ01025230.1.p1 GENE.GHVQ01025230.1~~GHVQ01025230.1.p1  ORF type:complete len:180 (+),score=13.58 GHVQ01025230.1:169-708(+)
MSDWVKQKQGSFCYLYCCCVHYNCWSGDDFCLPWKAFAGCEWWDTLKVPDYESLSPSDPSAASTDHGECHNMLRPTSSTKHIKKTPSSPCHNKTPSSFCLKKTPPSSYHNLCPLSESSSVGSSIREYFVEQVKLQTSQMLGLLRSILPGKGPCTHHIFVILLLENCFFSRRYTKILFLL